MKILHLGKYYPPFRGGMENFLADLARHQVSQGHEVKVLCHQHSKALSDRVECIQGGPEVIRIRIMGVAAYTPVAPGFYRWLKSVLEHFQPDIIHAHLPNVSAFWLLFLKKKIRLILHWHSDVLASANDLKLKMLYPFYRVFETRLLDRADAVICTSRPYLKTSLPLKKYQKKCFVVPLGINPDRYAARQKTSGNEAKVFRGQEIPGGHVLSVGRFTYYKGFEYLIKACVRGYSGRLVIAGEGPLRKDLLRLVDRLGLSGRVILPGKVSDEELGLLMSGCRAFCLPSIERTEAFGVVLLEAMSFGRALITTRVVGSGMNEVNAHNETGLVVEPEDARALALALQYMLDNPDHARDMGQKGRKRLWDRFVLDRIAREVEGVYERVQG